MKRSILHVPPEVMEVLKLRDWPGNIRELENFIRRSVIMSSGEALRPPFAELQQLPKSASDTVHRTLAEATREHILEVLRETQWVLGGSQGAAARLGLPRTTLVYRMQKLGISRERYLGRSRRSIVRTLDVSRFGIRRQDAPPLGDPGLQGVYA